MKLRMKRHPLLRAHLRAWAWAGLALGGLVAMVAQAPAVWLANEVAKATQGHLLLADARGTVWRGSGELVLTGGEGSREGSRLPGRLSWHLGWTAGAPELRLRLDCCTAGDVPLRLHPGWGPFGLTVPSHAEPLLRVPAAWLAGLGTPWNTLQLGGHLRLSSREFQLTPQAGRWVSRGALDLEFAHLSSRLSTLAPLGSYRLTLQAQPDGPMQLQLQTLEGALQLRGQGMMGHGSPMRFQGEASAAPGREMALNNLLNIIGRRQGDRSLITIG